VAAEPGSLPRGRAERPTATGAGEEGDRDTHLDRDEVEADRVRAQVDDTGQGCCEIGPSRMSACTFGRDDQRGGARSILRSVQRSRLLASSHLG
jgi:hypothetical protein